MRKILSLLSLLAMLSMGVAGCGKSAAPVAPGGLSVEERERLTKNAVKAYTRIKEKYPDSPHAEKAGERLKVLQPSGPPKK